MKPSMARLIAAAITIGIFLAYTQIQPLAAQSQPQITSVQILRSGQRVDAIVAGTRPKDYRIQIMGSGFDATAKVLLNGNKLRAMVLSSTQIVARPSAAVMIPGEASLEVMNPGNSLSGPAIIDIISNPSVLGVEAVAPNVALVGTQVTISGNGFTPTSNRVRFVRSSNTTTRGLTGLFDSPDGHSLTFSLPDAVCVDCAPGVPCPTLCFPLEAAAYTVAVSNTNGLSNSLKFVVSSAGGPIGIWSADGVAATVTDIGVDVEGACFSGTVPQGLVTDQAGNFDLAGTYMPLIGPIGERGIPAQFTGNVTGSTMTLTITVNSETIGPFTLTFGRFVTIIHPCV